MNLPLFLDTILVISIVALVAYLVTVLIQLRKTLASAEELIKNVNTQITPLSANLNEAVERVNKELDRVDVVVGSVQEMSERVQVTMEIIREVITSPLVKVASFSAGTREAIKRFISRD